MKRETEFRKEVKRQWPHVKVSIRTISFADLARDSAKFVTITGQSGPEEYRPIADLARKAGLIPQ